MFEVGDKYIHFTKYGGRNKGTVSNLHEKTHVDLISKCEYKVFGIVNQFGYVLWIGEEEIYKITKDDNFVQEETEMKYKRLI